MKIQLSLSVVLCMSGFAYGMQTNSLSRDEISLVSAKPHDRAQANEFLYVRAGGCSVKELNGPQKSQHVCESIYRRGNEFACTIVADNGEVLNVVKKLFFDVLKEKLSGDKLSVEQCLESAYKNCIATQEIKKDGALSSFFISCFSFDSQQLSLLRVGNVHGMYGGKHYQSTHKFENLHEPSCFGYEYSNDFGYYVGASDEFWKVIKRKEVPQLLLDAQGMKSKEFYIAYGINSDKRLSKDVLLYNNEDREVARIAKKLVEVAMSRGAGEDIAIVIKLFGSSIWDLDSCHTTSSSNSGQESGSGSIGSVDQLRELAKEIDMEQFISNTSNSAEEIINVVDDEKSNDETREQPIISDTLDRVLEAVILQEIIGDVYDKGFNLDEKEQSDNQDMTKQKVEAQEQPNGEEEKPANSAQQGHEELVLLKSETREQPIHIKTNSVSESVAPKESWRLFIGKHKLFVGGCVVALLAAMVVAYKYHCLPLNYIRV